MGEERKNTSIIIPSFGGEGIRGGERKNQKVREEKKIAYFIFFKKEVSVGVVSACR